MDVNHIPYEQLIAYAAKQLDEAEFDRFRAHFAECAECAGTVRRYRLIRSIALGDFSDALPASALARAHQVFLIESQRYPSQNKAIGLPNLLTWFTTATQRFSFAKAWVVVLLVASFVLGGVSAVSARDAIPGDFLYPVKLSVEALQVATANDETQLAQLNLVLLQKRADEMTELIERGRYNDLSNSSVALEVQTEKTIAVLDQIAKQDPERAEQYSEQISATFVRNEQVLTNLAAQAPAKAQLAIRNVLNLFEQKKVSVKERGIPERPTPTPQPTPTNTPIPGRTPTMVAPSTNSQRPPDPSLVPDNRGKPGVPPGLAGSSSSKDKTPGPSMTPPGLENKTPGPPVNPPGLDNKPPDVGGKPPDNGKGQGNPNPPGQDPGKSQGNPNPPNPPDPPGQKK